MKEESVKRLSEERARARGRIVERIMRMGIESRQVKDFNDLWKLAEKQIPKEDSSH